MNIKERMGEIDRLNMSDSQKDSLLAKEMYKEMYTQNTLPDGSCFTASGIACMGFMGYGLRTIPRPGTETRMFEENLKACDNTVGLKLRKIWAGDTGNLEASSNDTIVSYKSKLSEQIKTELDHKEGTVIVALEAGTHFISAFYNGDRVWYVDPLRGVGFNCYESNEKLEPIQRKDTDSLPNQFCTSVLKADWTALAHLEDGKWYKGFLEMGSQKTSNTYKPIFQQGEINNTILKQEK